MSLDSVDEVETINETKEVQTIYKAQLEYIETTGSEYIDTEVIGKTGVSCEADILATNSKGSTALVIIGASSNGANIRPISCGTNGFYTVYGKGSNYSSTVGNFDKKINIKSELYNGTQKISIDDTKQTSTRFEGDINTGVGMYLFANNASGTAKQYAESGTRLYSLKIYDNGELIRDYIPVIDNNDIACLYDQKIINFIITKQVGIPLNVEL